MRKQRTKLVETVQAPTPEECLAEVVAMVEAAKANRDARRAQMIKVTDLTLALGLARGSGSIKSAMWDLCIKAEYLPSGGTSVAFITKEQAQQIITKITR